ncbi:MAG: Rrf2 family transcriptional regulator [Fibrobacteria bacterium]|nr:Rrf2 family transcriptional regulator [Fibrobacteria bacterium]
MAFSYGKTSSNAIAVASLLSERWARGQRTSSLDAAKARGISRPLAAKLMVQMSQAGIITGTPGPHGGYSLARPPSEIALAEIVSLFQKADTENRCPYGPGWCGNNEPCPLHDKLVEIDQAFQGLMERTSLEVFAKQEAAKAKAAAGSTPAKSVGSASRKPASRKAVKA